MQGLTPFPPPGLPPVHGPPGLNSGQYPVASQGTNVPQLYYGAPPYPPFNQYTSPWGYYPPGAFPDAVPHSGHPQPTGNVPSNSPVQVNQVQACAEGQLATNPTGLTESRPRRFCPNTQVSKGGMSLN